jgi:hypothetical protein
MGSCRASPRKRRGWRKGFREAHGYRRRAKARQEAALAFETSRRREVLSRAEAFTRQLQAELAEAARCHAIAAGIIGEMSDFNHWSTLGKIGVLGLISVLKK